MTESFPIRGTWWLAGNDERRVAGTLQTDRSPATLTLELDGTVRPTPAEDFGDLPTILGRTVENSEITLCDTRNTGRQQTGLGAGMMERETVSARFGLLGGHFPQGSAATFSSYAFRTTHLAEWASRGYMIGSEDHQDDVINLSVKIPKPVELRLPWGRVSIRYGWGQSTGLEEATLRRPVSWILDLDAPQTVDTVTNSYLWPLEQFLSFACDGRVTAEEVTMLVTRPGPIGFAEIAVLRPPRSAPPRRHPRGRFEMLFALADVEDRLESMLQTWFENLDLLRSSLDLLFGLVLGPDMYLESRFLLVAQGIEVFHRRRQGGVIEPVAEWKQRISRVTAPLSRTDAAWVKEKLSWSNELTLHKRIEQLLTAVQETASNFLRPEFVKVFKATRNYYTHFDLVQYQKAAHGEDLYWLTEECFALMQLILLNMLGITATESWTWMRRTQRVQNLVARRSS